MTIIIVISLVAFVIGVYLGTVWTDKLKHKPITVGEVYRRNKQHSDIDNIIAVAWVPSIKQRMIKEAGQ